MSEVYQVRNIGPVFRFLGHRIMDVQSRWYPVEIEGLEYLVDINETGGILWANHQSGHDILNIGRAIRQVNGAYGRFVMRDTLKPQWVLERAQGMPVMRDSDYLTEDMDDETKKLVKAQVNRHNRSIYRAIGEAVDRSELVVLFPQITRHGKLEDAVKGNFLPAMFAQSHLTRQGSEKAIRQAAVRLTYTPRSSTDKDNHIIDVVMEVFEPITGTPREIHEYWHECMNSK